MISIYKYEERGFPVAESPRSGIMVRDLINSCISVFLTNKEGFFGIFVLP